MSFIDRLSKKKKDLTGQYQERGVVLFGQLQTARERFGWLDVIYESVEGFVKDRMTLHAGNFAYSAFLGIFPLLLFVFSIVGYIFHYDPGIMQWLKDGIKNALPDMQATATGAAESVQRLRGTIGVIGLVGLLWSMSRITYSFQLGFEAAWGIKQRGYIMKKVYSVALMLLLLVVAIVGLGITFVSTHLFSWVNEHTGPVFSSLMVVLSHIVSPAATILIFAMLYRTIPKNKPGWKEIFWGALPMALLLDLFEYGLGIYFTSISQTQALYGSMGIVIGVVLWLYFVGIFIFLGAEIVQTLQKRWKTAPAIMKAGGGEGPPAGIAPESDEAEDG